MITLYNGPIPETAMGCRIKTLYNCYKDIPGTVDLYTDGDAVICRFENTLIATEISSLDEFITFAEALGISEIELEAKGSVQVGGWQSCRHPILFRDCSEDREIQPLISLKDCFDIISASDEDFAQNSSYLYWLSDITRRQNRGHAKVYCQNSAAAVVSAISEKAAYLSSVAVCPQNRKEGRASQLLNRLCVDKILSNKRLYTAAQTEAVAELYLKNGFSLLKKSIITLKRSKF